MTTSNRPTGFLAAAFTGPFALALTLGGCGEAERTFDGERALGHIVAQVELGPRVPGSAGHRAGLEYILDELEGKADRLWTQRFTAVLAVDSSRAECSNVVATFRPEAGTRILFGAHWDTRAVADSEEDESLRSLPVPGANDGASGVAVLLEVARALAERPPSRALGVDLVFFDAEDGGVHDVPESWAVGSRRFVQAHASYRPAFAVILDMVGRRGTRIAKEGNSVAAAPVLVERVFGIAERLGISVLVDSLGPPVMDDHVPFLQARIPAIDLIDLSDPDWHTTRDLPGNCSAQSLAEVGRLVLALVSEAEESLSP